MPLRPVFLANRNLEPMYDVGCVLRAFALVQARHPHARLVVAGDGSRRGELEALAASLGLRDVSFVGRIDPARMNALYDEADVYLNASEIDNAPASILEAFASGVPVVTTNAGGIPYLVEHERTGMMVERGDHAGLAAAALRLLDEPALAAALIARAGEECRARYHWAAVRDQWLDLYRSLAGRATPAAAGTAAPAWTEAAA
jgi:glycosyltransferase involved in cell wall biosynthesis